MSALKKKITSHNLSKFLEEHLLVFFFNYNHINIQEWRAIKSQLSKIKKVSQKVVKNQIANNVIKKTENQPFEKLTPLFQGPTFLIGMSSPQECEQVFKELRIIKKQKKAFFVGGLYQGQYINHLDLPSILKGEKQVYANLINLFQSSLRACMMSTYLIPLYSTLNSCSFKGERDLE